MPEPSARDREKAADLEAQFASYRLVDALERGWTITFKCQYCGTGKTWHRDTMLGRARKFLGLTMAQIQGRVVCPRCPGHLPAMSFSGALEPADRETSRAKVAALLLDAGLHPSDYGYGWRGEPIRRD